MDINNILDGDDDDSSVSSMSTLIELEDENQGANNSGIQMQEVVVNEFVITLVLATIYHPMMRKHHSLIVMMRPMLGMKHKHSSVMLC